MQNVKRIEIVIDALKAAEVAEGLERLGLAECAILPGGTGRGATGNRAGDDLTGFFANSYMIVACEESKLAGAIAFLKPILEEFGGLCLVSDAQSLRH